MDFTADQVRIHYHRLPYRRETYVQHLVARTPDCIVTFQERTPISTPVKVQGQVVLEPGSPATWFTFPGRWHDIGLFYRANGEFTGVYANVLTPVHMLDGNTWETTDLFLDVWLGAGPPEILDSEELDEALAHGWIAGELAARARAEAEAIRAAATAGQWPPAIVAQWPIARIQQVIEDRR